jgi:chromosomal replication initiator protein
MPTIRAIQAAVAARYGVSATDLAETKTGGRGDARPRLLVMWLARQCTPYTLARIGRHFGGRDHKTVANAVKRVDRLMQIDRQLAEAATSLREALA